MSATKPPAPHSAADSAASAEGAASAASSQSAVEPAASAGTPAGGAKPAPRSAPDFAAAADRATAAQTTQSPDAESPPSRRPSRNVLPPGALGATDRAILNALQEGFPVTPRPYDDAGAALGITGDDLIARITRLRDIGAITRFGPFYDAAAMGGAFCLCAMAVPADRWDEVLTMVNARPEVAHNYERSHALNMWFVLATDRLDGIDRTARAIEAETGLDVMLFPKLEEYFIGFRVRA